jgi:hypothetical protein
MMQIQIIRQKACHFDRFSFIKPEINAKNGTISNNLRLRACGEVFRASKPVW